MSVFKILMPPTGCAACLSWTVFLITNISFARPEAGTMHMSRAMGKCVFGVNLTILSFCDFQTGHYMKSKLVFV